LEQQITLFLLICMSGDLEQRIWKERGSVVKKYTCDFTI